MILHNAPRALLMMIALALAACSLFQETPQQRAQRIEPMLSAAGFQVYPADTPDKQARLQALTPLKVRYYPKDGKPQYWFADPVSCNCLYAGGEAAYQRYEKMRFDAQMQQEAENTAAMNEEAAQEEEMDWLMFPGPVLY